MNSNPLSHYFRKPVLYISLPSAGRFYPENAIDLIDDNQYPILPLTRQDEMVFMTATTQNNGSPVVSIIESCVPNIKDAWKMPAVDIDKLLVAIKIAAHGTKLDIVSVCPNCEQENQSAVDLQMAVELIESPNYDEPLRIDDLEIYFQPVSYRQLNDNNLSQFDEESLITMLTDDSVDEQVKSDKIAELLSTIRKMATTVLSQNIQYVQTPSGRVDEQEYIREWLSNCDSKIYMQLQGQVIKNKELAELKPAEITCANCATQYQHVYNLNISNNSPI
jgi:hypothetical protein